MTKEKTWKNLCPEANPEMAESSAAGYQLRRHYQKYLLNLECSETGASANDLIAFAEKQKKSKKKKTPESADTSFSSPGNKLSLRLKASFVTLSLIPVRSGAAPNFQPLCCARQKVVCSSLILIKIDRLCSVKITVTKY